MMRPRLRLSCAALLALAACGGPEQDDGTAGSEEPATGAEVNAAVRQAEAQLNAATAKVQARQDVEKKQALDDRRAELAGNTTGTVDLPPLPR